jgi:NAD(P)-dependent dehydrogenase (short-subunit alcohol dehydrogenase family)/acyl carrier protein
VWDVSAVRAVRPDVEYHVVYLGDDIAADPHSIGRQLRLLVDRCAGGELRPLPRHLFPVEAASQAFRFMAQGRHIGKLVLTFEPASAARRVSADGAYLIAGGSGALGLHAARWLVRQGARHVVLAARSSTFSAADLDLGSQAQVSFERCDIRNADDVRRLVSQFGGSYPPLRGVIHAAGELHDGTLARQSWDEFEAALRAKVSGAWHLHRATSRLPLDVFLCYSSVASVLGSSGQGAYAAANAFMDALAHHRHSAGLPATSIGWGTWAPGGMSARLPDSHRERWAADGMRPMSEADGDAVLNRMFTTRAAHVVAARLDWSTYAQRHASRARLLESASVPQDTAAESQRIAANALCGQLARLAQDDRYQALLRHVRERILALVGLRADHAVDERIGFTELGLDSLTAVELRNMLQRDFACPLPATLAFDYPTLSALTRFLLGVLQLTESASQVESSAADREAAALETLSEAEVEQLLEAELGGLSSHRLEAS